MSDIRRYGDSKRWADVVVHAGVAHWVEVAEGCKVEMVITAATDARR